MPYGTLGLERSVLCLGLDILSVDFSIWIVLCFISLLQTQKGWQPKMFCFSFCWFSPWSQAIRDWTSSFKTLTPRPNLSFSLLSTIQFLLRQFREFGIGSINYLQNDIFLYSHHLSGWYFIDIVRRNSVLVTHGS